MGVRYGSTVWEYGMGVRNGSTEPNPESSRYCRFVGTQFESGRDYGEIGIRRYRLMVRTLVFETSDAGSIPANA